MNSLSTIRPNRVIMRLQYSEPPTPKTKPPSPYIEDRERAPSPDINIINQQLNIINSNQWVSQKIHKSQRVIQTSRYSEPPTLNHNDGLYLEISENAPSPDTTILKSELPSIC